MRYFLKTVLTKDQRVLLKLKEHEFVSSAHTDSVPDDEVTKVLDDKKLLEIYVEQL